MQAGLVNAPMNGSDIFTAPAALYAFHVAVVRVPVAVQLMHTSPARAVIVLVAARTQIGCLINSEWRKHRMSSALGSVSVRFESCTSAERGYQRRVRYS